jgi:preprotein translocase subunit SecA
MRDQDVAETVADMRRSVVGDLVTRHIPENAYPEQWETPALKEAVHHVLGLELPVDDWAKEEGIADEEVKERVTRAADEVMAAKVAKYGAEIMRYVEKSVLLQTLDHLWREHLVMLDHLRQVIGFRGYAQRDPLNEYKSEAFQLFDTLLNRLREGVTAQLMRIEIVSAPPAQTELPPMEAHHINPVTGEDEMALAAVSSAEGGRVAAARNSDDPSSWGKVGRNEACPCGSGKKYKHCHGRFG